MKANTLLIEKIKESNPDLSESQIKKIISISSPPYFIPAYNPFITPILNKSLKKQHVYNKKPYVKDVSEGKTDPVYMAHTYHTKVPYKAIEHYINHYTEEGDYVLDAFSGSGMTAVAAKQCDRNAIISDLSPMASFMGAAITSDVNIKELNDEFDEIIQDLRSKFSWLYETDHEKGTGVINYILWCQDFACNFCGFEYNFWDLAYDNNEGKLKNEYTCPSCKAKISKSNSKPVEEIYFDTLIDSNIERLKFSPVFINYKYRGKTYTKSPSSFDIERINRIENYKYDQWIPSYKYLFTDGKWGDMWRAGVHQGTTHVHHFFTKANLIVLSHFFDKVKNSRNRLPLMYVFTSFLTKTGSKLHNVGFKKGKINLAGAQPNSLYIPSIYAERNIFTLAKRKFKDISKAYSHLNKSNNSSVYVQTCSATDTKLPDASIDYVFTDPPFGDNLMYSEMNFLWESWLDVFTENEKEAIINKTQNKGLDEYQDLMLASFREYYRVLKPNRWMTVVFHNSKSAVWNSIQNSIAKAGFIVSQVLILDKQQGTKNQMTASGAVEKDLVISSFKPSTEFERKIAIQSIDGLDESFVHEFLNNQPIQPVLERTEKMLYSKLLAFYIQKGYEIELDAKSFYKLLKDRFYERNGFWYTNDELNEIDAFIKRQRINKAYDASSGMMDMFIVDEKSAIIWLDHYLIKPHTYSNIYTAYTQLANNQNDKTPELIDILDQNFIKDGNTFRRPETATEHGIITEKRQKHLWKEFETILIQAQTERKKIKEVRKEALIYGFERCYKDKRFKDILSIVSNLHPSILENNGELSDFVDAAEIQVDGLS